MPPRDYATSARLLGPLADFVVVNCQLAQHPRPARPAGRRIAAPDPAAPCSTVVTVPVLVKIAPDLSDDDIDAVADLAVELGLAGIVATNTTISRDGLRTPTPPRSRRSVRAGCPALPVAERSLEVLRRLLRPRRRPGWS